MRPAARAWLTSVWLGYPCASGAFLPAVVQRAFNVGVPLPSSALFNVSNSTVPFSAPTFLPHRSSCVLILSGLHFGAMIDTPALKYVTKSTAFSRSLLSVNEEMPRSYLCAARPEERRVGKECRSRWSRYH